MLILALAVAASSDLDHCLDTGDAARGVTAAMAACFVADYRRADAALNATYAVTMKRLPPAKREALRASQRSWIGQRDAACPINEAPGAGSIERLNHPNCLAKQTDRRTAWLRRYR